MNEDESIIQEHAGEAWDTVSRWFIEVWNMELFSSSGSPVRLSQIIVALTVLIIGIMIGRRLAALLGRRLQKSGRLDRSTAYRIWDWDRM